MAHRYGRHGLSAWRRWRERHVIDQPRDVSHEAPLESVIVVYVRLPKARLERIIVVLDFDGNIVDSTPPFLSSGEKRDARAAISWHARTDAGVRADKDIANHEAFSSDFSTEKALREDAKRLGYACVKTNFTTPEQADWIEASELVDIYVEAFVARYRRIIDENEGTIPDEATSRINRIAREDKQRDGNMLSPNQITYQSAIRAYEHYPNLDTRTGMDYLEPIENFIRVYKSAYTEYTRTREKNGGEGQDNWPHSFR